MFPKNLRLDPKEIPLIARRGKKFENEFFFIRAWFEDSLASPKFAISISVKVDKRAVTRNRIKRKLRAVIAELESEEYDFRKAKYLFVIKKKELKDLDNKDIKKLLQSLI